MMIFIVGIIKRDNIEIENVLIHSDELPSSFNGYRIAQFSDFHLGSLSNNPDYVEKVVRTINSLHPDLIVFTGDLVNSRQVEASHFKDVLCRLKAPDGVYSILGNHDYGYYYHWTNEYERVQNVEELKLFEKRIGWKLLLNEHVFLTRQKDSIAIIGIENWGRRHYGQQGDLNKALYGISSNIFSILLSHNPDFWEDKVVHTDKKENTRNVIDDENVEKFDSNKSQIINHHVKINLTLSGHTHAMQMKFGDYSPSKWFYSNWNGVYCEESQYLYVNRGVGFVILPARIGDASPEITVIELQNN